MTLVQSAQASVLQQGAKHRLLAGARRNPPRNSCNAALPPAGLATAPVLAGSMHSTMLHAPHMQLGASFAHKAHGWPAQPVAAPAVTAVRLPHVERTTSRLAVAADPGSSLSTVSARDKVLALLDQGFDNYNPGPELGPAVERLVSHADAESAPARTTMTMAHGTWEVFYAPHITKMSSAFGTKFQPIRYRLTPIGELISNVRYSSPVLGNGWLSASGSLWDCNDTTLELQFDRFWVDVGEASLRPELRAGEAGDGALQEAFMDRLIGTVGRASFIKQLALFPVRYLDNELAVFDFPPLKSSIAVRKLV